MNKNIQEEINCFQIMLSKEFPDKAVSVSISEKPDLIIKFVVLGKLKSKLDNAKKTWKNIKKEGRKVKRDFNKATRGIEKQINSFDPGKDLNMKGFNSQFDNFKVNLGTNL